MNLTAYMNFWTFLAYFWTTLPCYSQSDFLDESWKKQSEPLHTKTIHFDFHESANQLLHSFSPWQQTNLSTSGEIWSKANDFSKIDTLHSNQRIYLSKIVLSEQEMLQQNYGKEQLEPLTKNQFQDQVFLSARYLPNRLLNYFKKLNPSFEISEDKFAVYSAQINQTRVKLFIDTGSSLLSKIQTFNHDELFGDVETEYTYSDYIRIDDFFLARHVDITKVNGKLLDQVKISQVEITDSIPQILERPAEYHFAENNPTTPVVTTSAYNKQIHLVELKHTDDRSMIVEFSDFLLVAEAPLSSENGELIIAEAKKIAPDKPIKYFVFGHYHPHYIGGVRPFVHQKAKIIASVHNQEYLSYIVNAKRTIQPDSLSIVPTALNIELITDSLRISDGKTILDIYLIGEKSKHTIDYLIYHFPDDRILFEDDLVWIPKEGEVKNISNRQIGLYEAIRELGLEVDTIIQSWPVSDYGVKTIIPFEELENTIKKNKL